MKLRHPPPCFPLNFSRFLSASRILLSDSCLDRALAVLTLRLVITAVPIIAHGTETPSSTNDTKAILATKEELAGACQRFQDAELDYVQGRLEKAETGYRGVIEIRTRLLGTEHPVTLDARRNLASALSRQGKYAEAESELRGVIAVSLRGYGKIDPIAWSVHEQLAAVLEWQSRYAEAEKEWRTALLGFERSEKSKEEKEFFINHARLHLAKNLAYQHKKEEALAMAQQAHEGYRKSQGDNDQITKQAKILVDMREPDVGHIGLPFILCFGMVRQCGRALLGDCNAASSHCGHVVFAESHS
jgi:tetratricopeptide (TPR) repeat protein